MHHQVSQSTRAVASTARTDWLAPKLRFSTSVARWDRPTKKQLNALVNKSMPSNMRRLVYNTVKMGKSHCRIQIPVFWTEGKEDGKPACSRDSNSAKKKKTANCFRRGLAIGHKTFTPDRSIFYLVIAGCYGMPIIVH